MKYMGSKRKISKYIIPIMVKNRKLDQYWVEPFVGGANLIDKIEGNRIGADVNKYIIETLKVIRDDPKKFPNKKITKEQYNFFRKNLKKFPDWYIGFLGTTNTFGSKFLGTYAKGKNSKEKERNYSEEGCKNAIKQSPNLKGVEFICISYKDLTIPENSIIYCDPPYKGTCGYKVKFNHDEFFEWCRLKTREGHTVYISEYTAPEDFTCIWEKEVTVNLNNQSSKLRPTEKLFIYKI